MIWRSHGADDCFLAKIDCINRKYSDIILTNMVEGGALTIKFQFK